jgi:hypothetical protein
MSYTSEHSSYFGNRYAGLSDYVRTKKQIFDIIGYRCYFCDTEYDIEDLEMHHPQVDGHEDISKYKTRVSMYRYYVKHPQEAQTHLVPICKICHTGYHGY